MRDGLLIESIEIGNINLAVPTAADFVGDFGFCDSLATDRFHKVIRERMRLPTQRSAGIAFRQNGTFVEFIRDVALEISVVAAGDQILRAFGIREAKSLNIEIELQDFSRFAGETAHRNPDGWNIANSLALSIDVDLSEC